MKEFEKYVDAVRRLNGLLSEPEPGLFSWYAVVQEVHLQVVESSKVLGLKQERTQ